MMFADEAEPHSFSHSEISFTAQLFTIMSMNFAFEKYRTMDWFKKLFFIFPVVDPFCHILLQAVVGLLVRDMAL